MVICTTTPSRAAVRLNSGVRRQPNFRGTDVIKTQFLFHVLTEDDTYSEVFRGFTEFSVLPRVGEAVTLLLPGHTGLGTEISESSISYLEVKYVVHTPRAEGYKISLSLDSIIVPTLTEAVAITAYLNREFSYIATEDLLIENINSID